MAIVGEINLQIENLKKTSVKHKHRHPKQYKFNFQAGDAVGKNGVQVFRNQSVNL